MVNKILLSGLVLIAFFGLSQADWVQQHAGPNRLYDLDFPRGDIENGFACGENSFLLKTNDGGEHWEERRANPSGNFNSIFFVDAMNGFIACDSGNIQSSRDGGENWELINLGTTNNLNCVYFTSDPNIGYVVGMGGVVRKTNDGGMNWEEVLVPVTEDFYGVYFTDPARGYLVGTNGTILFTADGGMTWAIQNSNVTTRLWDVFMIDENKIWVVGDSNTCLRTTDGGQTWDPVTLPIPAGTDLYSITFPDSNSGFICGIAGRILKTTDGGNTWELNATLFYHFYRIEFPRDNLIGWVCGLSEAIFYTNDAGEILEQPLNRTVKKDLITCSPNPFRTKTIIQSLQKNYNLTDIRVYDINGKLVKSFFNCSSVIWDGRNEIGQRVPPGVYLLEYKIGTEPQWLKLTVLN